MNIKFEEQVHLLMFSGNGPHTCSGTTVIGCFGVNDKV